MTDVDLIMKRGDDFKLVIMVEAGGVPLDLTTYTAAAQVRSEEDSAVIIASFDATITDDVNGEITLIMTHTDSADLVDGVWDCQIIDADNNDWTSTIVAGTVTVDKDVTRL